MKLITRLLLPLLLLAALAAPAHAQRGIKHKTAKVQIEATGAVTVTPATGKTVTVSGAFVPYSTKTALTPGATVTVTSTTGNFFTLTPAQDEAINATTVGVQGQPLIIKVLTSGTSSYTLTFGTNFKSTGTLATGTVTAKTFMVGFLSDGTNYIETFRTAAQ